MTDDIFDLLTTQFAEKIFKYPGAFIRSVFNKIKKFKELILEKTSTNMVVGIVVTLPFYVLILMLLIKYF